MTDTNNNDETIEQWKLKRLIKMLDTAKIMGSCISIIIPPKGSISDVSNKLNEEFGVATSIKSKQTRQSVQDAIVSARERLKLYNRTPKNGLVLYVGTVLTEKGEKRLTIDLEPYRPINISI